jgi:hypothetical protein
MEQINPGHPLPDSITSTMAICRDTAGILRGSDLNAIAGLSPRSSSRSQSGVMD